MLAMVDKETFTNWLETELLIRDMSQSELARQAGVTRAAINGILTGARGPGSELCIGIAKAFLLPPETVFRKAGLLPPAPKENDKTRELTYLASQMPETALDDLLEFARHRLHLAEKRGEYKTK